VQVHVLVVDGADNGVGAAVVGVVEAAGHTLGERLNVDADSRVITDALRALCAVGRCLVVVVGGSGFGSRYVAVDAVELSLGQRLDGFGDLLRQRLWSRLGPKAMFEGGTCGLLGASVVAVIPGEPEAARVALGELVLPGLDVLWSAASSGQGPSASRPAAATFDDLDDVPVVEGEIVSEPSDADVEDVDEGPQPSGTLGHLGRQALSMVHGAEPGAEAAPPPPGEAPAVGWRRAVFEIGGEILREGRREELPQPIETLAPVVEVLHSAGEQAVLRLPSGVTYSLWGFPDLRRSSSKVLAVGWGQPLCEVLVLHRYPVQTGTCIEEGHGLLPGRSDDLAEVCREVTGAAPDDPSGALFAVAGETVWIDRGGRAVRWDGRREREEGTLKQALASLVLHWSQR
jgi:molybdenum cofactor biosynthesis protein B